MRGALSNPIIPSGGAMAPERGMNIYSKVGREDFGTGIHAAGDQEQMLRSQDHCERLKHPSCEMGWRQEVPSQHCSSPSRNLISRKSYIISRLCILITLITILMSSPIKVEATFIRKHSVMENIMRRDDSPTDVCSRWSQQSAIINGTLYVYGGRSIQQEGQTSNTWNNDFFSLPLTESWDISTPKLAGLPQPSGPPQVANGYLWNSYDALYLYGGEYSDTPEAAPDPFALWEYDIKSSSWKKHDSPKTSAGNNSDGGNQPVQGSAEGAGITVPQLGRGWYFGGHLDHYTTPGWSKQTSRAYLKSLLEFTFPGYSNDGVQSLGDGKIAGDDGVWRNVTSGGIQDSAAFPSRADGVLVYIPGFGVSGIILSLAAGNNESFVSHHFYSQ